MAEHLSEAAKNMTLPALLLSSLLVVAPPAAAQPLPDPTRPPDALFARAEQNGAATSAGPVLQSVLISPTRREAVINGQTVKVGDKLGGARIMRIAENEVVLRNGKDVQTLKVFPNVEKRLASSRTDAKAKADMLRQE